MERGGPEERVGRTRTREPLAFFLAALFVLIATCFVVGSAPCNGSNVWLVAIYGLFFLSLVLAAGMGFLWGRRRGRGAGALAGALVGIVWLCVGLLLLAVVAWDHCPID